MTRTGLAGVEAFETRADDRLIPGIAADGTLFPIDKMEAHRQGVLHLAVSIFVMSGDAVLLQRRALSKYHCGGLWANTCCSHPTWGETPADGASRRLSEELNLSLPLKACSVIEYAADVTNGLHEHERVHVFRAEGDIKTPVTPNPNEVLATRWASIYTLQRDVRIRPEVYAPWFRIYLARWDELGL
ncbi:MAG: NUDIX domain-containing protein [Hyphomonadaceae bacterium]|nr:NUDIX domain-containing protein [Hyphomonadaceae bacterium]